MHVSKVDCRSDHAATRFAESLRSTGFAILQHHPIDSDLVSQVYADWARFFSSEGKSEYHFNAQTQDGFFPYLSENAKGAKDKDLKEFFHYYPWGQCPDFLRESTARLYKQFWSQALSRVCKLKI